VTASRCSIAGSFAAHPDHVRAFAPRPPIVVLRGPSATAPYRNALDEAESVLHGEQRIRALIGELDQAGHTSAETGLAEDLDTLLVHLRYSLLHRREARSCSNSRSGGPLAHRRISRFHSRTSCLSLCWTVLDSSSPTPPASAFTERECHALERVQGDQHRPITEEVIGA
jgi:hypothetical protein